jgi:hypothetical protein
MGRQLPGQECANVDVGILQNNNPIDVAELWRKFSEVYAAGSLREFKCSVAYFMCE